MLWKAVKDILQIVGFDIAAIERDLGLNEMKKHRVTKQSLPVAWPGYANLQQGSESV